MKTEKGFVIFEDRGVFRIRYWKSNEVSAAGKIMPLVDMR